MFGEKTLTDIVKGIRASKRDTGLYISSCIAEIKTELKSSDLSVKCNALQKLTFLQMMGYNMSYASFACIEVMSSPRFAHKRIGYLAGCQGCFTNGSGDGGHTAESDVGGTGGSGMEYSSSSTDGSGLLLLTTNLLKKELRNASTFGYNGCYEAGLAINFLSNVVTEDLARELLPEVTALTQHPSHAYLRKKAVLCLFKIFTKYPQALRLAFDKVQACLSDTDPAVVSCAVNVITELSTHNNPRNYLLLAPQFFQLVLTSSNNWMLIKVVKLLGSLVSEEPRLARKLLEPLANIVRSTQAKSLLFEAVYTITLAVPHCHRKSDGTLPPNTPEILNLCCSHLKAFVQDSDQNLKYLGLVGFGSLIIASPSTITKDHKELILSCLSDQDVTIRSRALELLILPAANFATKKNIVELVTQLLKHVDAAGEGDPYQVELVDKIIYICKSDRYALLASPENFAWYLTDVLLRLAYMRSLEDAHGQLISNQMLDIALRVLPIRQLAVQKMVQVLLSEVELHKSQHTTPFDVRNNNKNKGIMKSVLTATAWIVGEYSHLLIELMTADESSETYYHAIVNALLLPHYSSSEQLSASTQAVYVQSAMKVFAAACYSTSSPVAKAKSTSAADLQRCLSTLRRNLPFFIESTDADVQERSLSFYKLLQEMDLLPTDDLPSISPFANLKESTATSGENARNYSEVSDHCDDSEDDDHPALNDLLTALPAYENLLNLDIEEQQQSIISDMPPSQFKLGEEQRVQATTMPLNHPSSTTSNDFSNDIIGKCRSLAEQLSKILIPEPMKPISAKAQRRLNPPLGCNLDGQLEMAVFSSIITIDNAAKGLLSYNRKSDKSIEDVSFTKLTTQHASQDKSDDPLTSTFGGGSKAGTNLGVTPSPLDIFTDGAVKQFLDHRSSANAPFYLTSSSSLAVAATESNTSTVADQHQLSNRFGAILLHDDDDGNVSDHDTADKRLNGKSKGVKKKSKKKTIAKASGQNMSDADMALLFSNNTSTSFTSYNIPDHSSKELPPKSHTVVYKSDDGEEENQGHSSRSKGTQVYSTSHSIPPDKSMKTKSARGFTSLAQVDLTTPLGKEEIIPVRTHRQVPERPSEGDKARTKTITKNSKRESAREGISSTKEHKKKKKNKKKSESDLIDTIANGDLLNFDVFDAVIPAISSSDVNFSTQNAFDVLSGEMLNAPKSSTTTSKKISLAPSNDLIHDEKSSQLFQQPGLSTNNTELTTGDAFTSAVKYLTNSDTKRPWLRATIKTDGINKLSIIYKVFVEKSSSTATVSMTLFNDGEMPLRDISLSFASTLRQPEVKIASIIAPGESADTPYKLGPFSYEEDAASGECISRDIKGHVSFSSVNGNITKLQFKIVLPCCLLFLKAKSGNSLSYDRIVEELSKGVWSSQSVKLDATKNMSTLMSNGQMSFHDVIHQLRSFLRAEVVGGISGLSNNAATLSAVSRKGTQIRLLIKVTDKYIKIDLKCSNGNEALCKAICSDLKRLVMTPVRS